MSSSESFLEKMNKIKRAWKKFIATGKIDTSVIRPVIADSCKRCRLKGLDPYSNRHSEVPHDQEIEALLKRNKILIDVSLPILKLINEMIKGSGFRVDLVDKNGYFLKSFCGKEDKEILKESKKLGPVIGANRSELIAGTNSMGIALAIGMPVQIVGPEHYNVDHHSWTCSAAPVRSPFGNVIGAVNISGNYRLLHRLPRLYRRGTHFNRLSSVPTCRELALIPTFTDGEFPLD